MREQRIAGSLKMWGMFCSGKRGLLPLEYLVCNAQQHRQYVLHSQDDLS